jgi:hypothetical protein
LERAKAAYHSAARAQPDKTAAFGKHVAEVITELERLRANIAALQRIVIDLDALQGLDESENRWLAIHLQSLEEHIEALRQLRCNGDTLIEFGEFLRRPANISQRITWR